MKSSPLPAKNLRYEVACSLSPPRRNVSYHGLTEAERQRQVPVSSGSQTTRFCIAEETAHKVQVLREEYRRQEVDKYLVEQAGFECQKRPGKCVITRGGFKEFEAKVLIRQPVSPMKLLLLQADGCETQGRIV